VNKVIQHATMSPDTRGCCAGPASRPPLGCVTWPGGEHLAVGAGGHGRGIPAAVEVVNSRGRPGFGGIPAVSPGHQCQKHRVQLPALLGRAVVLARGVVLVSLPGQYAVLERSGRIRSVLAGARRVRYPRFQASRVMIRSAPVSGRHRRVPDGPGRLTTGGSVLGRFFTWRVNLYRLFIGSLILTIVLPVQPSGYQPLWPVVARVPYEPGAWRNKASPS
jgi:hypothetical protein